MSGAPFVLALRGEVAVLRLARPAARNALDLVTIAGLTAAVRALPPTCRVLQLEGEGKSFCAGADLHWMAAAQHATAAENRRDAGVLAAMYAAIVHAPQAVLAVVHGPVRGGGCGLVAAADVALCSAEASFAFTEVRLGLVPAVIAPVVVPKIGVAAARALFLTAETFLPPRALQMGLVHEVVAAPDLAARAAAVARSLAAAGPVARAATKRLLAGLAGLNEAAATELAANTLAEVRAGPEAKAGLAAFFGRTQPPWHKELP